MKVSQTMTDAEIAEWERSGPQFVEATYVPCIHERKRWDCPTCLAMYTRERRAKDPEAYRAWAARWREVNREHIRAYDRAYRASRLRAWRGLEVVDLGEAR